MPTSEQPVPLYTPGNERQEANRRALLTRMEELHTRYTILHDWKSRRPSTRTQLQAIEEQVQQSQAVLLLDDPELALALRQNGLGDWIKQCSLEAMPRRAQDLLRGDSAILRSARDLNAGDGRADVMGQ